MPPIVIKTRLNDTSLKFVCDDDIEIYRAKTLFTKEEGTIRWLRDNVRPTDVIYDIGANIGIYSIFAASLGCQVVAFEPQLLNACSLMRNILKNGFEKRITILTCALHDDESFLNFNYNSMRVGSSGSQLNHTTDESGKHFNPVMRELKYATTVNNIIGRLAIPLPDLVKLDVDGNELLILKGMSRALGASLLRSIQVEMHPKDSSTVTQLLEDYSFKLVDTHYTLIGKQLLKERGNPDQIVYNAVFSRER